MAIRLIECHRILKQTGSLYLHCDPTMSHYLKTTLDCIFGEQNFRNEIVWKYKFGSRGRNAFGKKHDILLFYARSSNASFFSDAVRVPHEPDSLELNYRHVDEEGRRYRKGTWKSGKEYRYYADEGRTCDDTWADISALHQADKERTGYPTQKPLALLDRVIKASSVEGDIILDPFCGCATTCVAAENNGRHWIGIDVSQKAYDLVKERLDKEVARPHELPQFREEIHLQARPPKRTDIGASVHETKHVYIISHPKYPDEYKVGIAKNVKARLNSYQTGDPDRLFKIEFSHATHLYRQTESYIHEHFDNKHEWVRADLNDIKQEILAYVQGA